MSYPDQEKSQEPAQVERHEGRAPGRSASHLHAQAVAEQEREQHVELLLEEKGDQEGSGAVKICRGTFSEDRSPESGHVHHEYPEYGEAAKHVERVEALGPGDCIRSGWHRLGLAAHLPVAFLLVSHNKAYLMCPRFTRGMLGKPARESARQDP